MRWFALVIALACRSPARDEAATGSAGPHADPWSPDRALLFTFTVEARQEQRLAPPFHGSGGTWTYLAATAGGGEFGVLLPEYEQTRAGAGEIDTLELVPTTEADGKRVVSAFATAFEVDGPPFGGARGKRLVERQIDFDYKTRTAHPQSARVVQDAQRRGTWTRLTLFCEDAEIFFDFSIVDRSAAFAEKERRYDRDWAGCLATTLLDGEPRN